MADYLQKAPAARCPACGCTEPTSSTRYELECSACGEQWPIFEV